MNASEDDDRGALATGARAALRVPAGGRDLLPAAMRTRAALVDGLLAEIDAWGYDRVRAPAIEYVDVLERGLPPSERDRCVRLIEASSGAVVALSPDITPQIARIVAQHGEALGDGLGTLRLSYAARLVRLPDARSQGAELEQVGVEAIGGREPDVDAELVGLSHACLRRAGVETLRIDLAHASIVAGAMTSLSLPAVAAKALRGPIARKDIATVQAQLSALGVAARAIDAMVELCQAHGPPSVLERARAALAPLGVDEALDRLLVVLDEIARLYPAAYEAVGVDLGEVRGFDYYTGLRLRAWCKGASQPVVRGGRYDGLLGHYGPPRAATGFAIDVDALATALARAGLGATAPVDGVFVAVAAAASGDVRARALDETTRARAREKRACLDVLEDEAQACTAAARRGYARVTWYDATGAVEVRERDGQGAWRPATTAQGGDRP